MSGSSQAFMLPKAGSSEADYEDAFALAAGRIAIADGATESSFARAWADALVHGFTSEYGGGAGAEIGGDLPETRTRSPVSFEAVSRRCSGHGATRSRGTACPGMPRTRRAPARSPRCSPSGSSRPRGRVRRKRRA